MPWSSPEHHILFWWMMRQLRAINKMHGVYGIRRIRFDQESRQQRVLVRRRDAAATTARHLTTMPKSSLQDQDSIWRGLGSLEPPTLQQGLRDEFGVLVAPCPFP
jgi:hypothetical protein